MFTSTVHVLSSLEQVDWRRARVSLIVVMPGKTTEKDVASHVSKVHV